MYLVKTKVGEPELKAWKYLSATDEIIWYSERSDWGHLYLYSASDGRLKNQITSGDYVVRQVLRIDENKRQIYFIASGKEADTNPYYRYLYRVDFTGKNLTLLTPGMGDHTISFSPDDRFFLDSYSQPDVPPEEYLLKVEPDPRLVMGE